MTAIRAVLACAFLAMAAPVGAQITGGGGSGPVTPPDREPEQTEADSYAEMFPGRTFTRIGTAAPSGNYGELPSQTGYVYLNSSSIEPVFARGVGATSGFFLEIDRSVFPALDFLPIQLPMGHIGIGYGLAYSAAYVGMGWSDIFDYEDVEMAIGEFLTSIRVGPKVSYRILPELYFSTSLKLGLGAALGSYTEIYEWPLAGGGTVDITESMGPAFGMARSFGFDLQFTGISVGWELNSVGVTRTRTHDLYFSDGRTTNFEYEVAVPASTSRFYVGFDF